MLHASIEQEFLEISQIQKETYLQYLFIKVCLTLKRLEGDQFDTHHSCGFSKNVFFQRKGGFLVFCDSFNIFISHIFHENFIEIPQLVQKIWWHQHMASAIIYLQPTLNKLINNCIKIYWYHISSSWNLLLLLLPGAAGGTGGGGGGSNWHPPPEKTTFQKSSLIRVTSKFAKRRLQHKCFPVNFANIFKKSSLQNTFRRLLLRSFAFSFLLLLSSYSFDMSNPHS